MFKKINFYLIPLFLLFQTVITGNQIPNREIIVLLETMKVENLNSTLNGKDEYIFNQILHPTGISAITITMLIALNQKAAPIIANKSLIKNLIDHQNLFSDFINLDRNSLYTKYSHYNRFKGRQTLDNFRTNCQYFSNSVSQINDILNQLIKNDNADHIYQVLNKIVADKRFNLEFAPTNIKRLSQNPTAIKALILEMVIYLLCSWVDLQKDWQIKQVNEDIFLLIPNDYIKNLNLINPIASTPIQTLPSKFTDLELELGLKIDHMKKISRNFFEQPVQKNSEEIPVIKSLAQIFITTNDIKNNNSNKIAKHIWSIYMAGHGLPKRPHIEVLPQLNELRNLSKKKLSAPEFKACLSYEKNKRQTQLKGLTQIDDHVYQCKHHESCKKHMNKITKLNKEIKKIESINLSSEKEAHGIILSLSTDEFRDVLKFFNNDIEIAFLYYTSCFAGGNHLIQPYTENGKPLILRYPIISGTPAENMSLQEFPYINLPPYSKTGQSIMLKPSDISTQDIDIPNKKLELVTTLQFNNFFGALRKGIHNDSKNILLVPYSLHPHIDTCGKIINQLISNIPLIRLANTDHFQPIPNDYSSEILDAKNSTKSIAINKDAALIYTDYISGKVTLNKLGEYQDIPKMFSMIPGFAAHTFEEISSSTLNLKEIVNSFLTFPELGSSKIFWIKKLECKNSGINGLKTKVFNDVIIMRNVFNSDTLARCSNEHLTHLETCAYLSTNANKEAKLTWNGPFIEDNNYKINSCSKSDHKEECLNCFPNIANFLSPVLQSI